MSEQTLTWRGSASDLATDIDAILTDEQTHRLISELRDKLRCPSVDDVGGRCRRDRKHAGGHESSDATVQWTDQTPQRRRAG